MEIRKKYPEKITKIIETNYLKITNIKHKIADNENNNSLLFHICIDKICTLFLGDASKEVEEEIIKNYKMKALILKVAHHGSKTSTSSKLLDHVSFQYGVISVGKKNQYSHPHSTTLEELKKHHINILETKTLGTICFKIKKDKYTFFSFPP